MDFNTPLSVERLRRLRLTLRKSVPAQGLGQHIRRRAGQSLEFREHRPYALGEDIRKVDWRASLRSGRPDQLLVRSYEAEEKLTLAIVVDMRAAMQLPQGAEKLTFALWATLSLAEIAAESGDDLLLTTVFGSYDGLAPLRGRGRTARAAARRFVAGLRAAPRPSIADSPQARTDALVSSLNPASAVLLISDMLFEDCGGAVTKLALAAQKSRRELIVLELDSFEAEATMLSGRQQLEEVEGRVFGSETLEIGAAEIVAARTRIDEFRQKRHRAWNRGGLNWPLEHPAVFPSGQGLAGLQGYFSEEFGNLPAIRAILARGGM